MAVTTPNKSVAIIGGGQLGTLLCEAARSLGIKTLVVTPQKQAPALSLADEYIVAAYDEPCLGQQIADRADVVTVELEAVPEVLLAALEVEQSAGRLTIHPDVSVLRLLKNKARQKRWLTDNAFATADFIEVDADTIATQRFLQTVSFPFVQKAQEGGYDGYGVQVIREASNLDKLWPVPSILETFLQGARELSVVVARSERGEIELYPPVEMAVDQERNVLDVVIVPAPLPPPLLAAAEALAREVVSALQGVGVFAVEMFLLDDTTLLVNEVSPRVHNSGHHTLESAAVSQFEQHMRAVAGMALKATSPVAPSIMKNILYDDSMAPLLGSKAGRLSAGHESVRVHWYGKKEARPGRKMGHITCVGVDVRRGRKIIDETLSGLVPLQGE